jgi:hypothetical protein
VDDDHRDRQRAFLGLSGDKRFSIAQGCASGVTDIKALSSVADTLLNGYGGLRLNAVR